MERRRHAVHNRECKIFRVACIFVAVALRQQHAEFGISSQTELAAKSQQRGFRHVGKARKLRNGKIA